MFYRALLLALLVVLLPRATHAQTPVYWYECQLTSFGGQVVHRSCVEYLMPKAPHDPVGYWKKCTATNRTNVQLCVRYPEFVSQVPPQYGWCLGPTITQWDAAIQNARLRTGVDGNLIAAVMFTESSGLSGSESTVGAVGLMQVMPATAAPYGVYGSALWDPWTNVYVGALVLRDFISDAGGNTFAGLEYYNAGFVNPGAGYGYAATVMSRVCS